MRRLSPLALLVLLFAVAPVRSDDWPVPRGPSREPLPYAYTPTVLKELPREFLEDAPACILYARTTYLVEPDGTTEATSHEVTRFNGRKGIEKLGEYRNIYFNPRYEKLTLNEARVIKADGTSVPVEPRHVQLRDVATDFQVYDEDKQLVISWPNLQVGDTYEVKWTIRGKNPEYGGQFFTRYTFGDDDHPVARDELYVCVPKDMPLKYADVNARIELTKTEGRRDVHYHWKTRNKAPLPHDDERPSKEELQWQVACSTFADWQAIGKWKQKVRAECWDCTPAIKEVVAKVAGKETTPLAKARALTYWVRQNIRYLSRGPEGLGFTPHPPAAVLGNRFGDCKDQAQLLAVMLRDIGLPVWLVTLGTLDDGQVLEAVPSPWGTHAILHVEIEGKAYWIDTTVSQAAWDFLPRADCNRQVYLTRDGQIKLGRTPEFTYKDYRIEQTTFVNVTADGASHCKRQVSYLGSSAWYKRDAWIDTPLGERRRLVANELQDAHGRARLLALKVDERSLREYDGPVRAEMDFEIPEHFTGEPREGTLSDSVIWGRLLSYTFDPSREQSFNLPMPFESIHRFIVQVPAALHCTVSLDDRKIDSPWGFFDVQVKKDPSDAHRIEIQMHTRLEKTRVEKADFARFQRFHEDVTKAYRTWLTLRPTRELADAPGLEALLKESPADSFSATVLARLYLDNNKHAEARRVLAAAVKYAPGDTTLWDLRLKAAGSDLAARESLYRAMIEQFPKESQYVAALGASLVESSQFAEARKVLAPLAENAIASVRGAAHYQLARACYEQRALKDALKHLESAVADDIALLTDVKALEFKARLHAEVGETTEAMAAYRLALELDASAHELLPPLIRLELQTKLKREALDHLRKYTVTVAKDPAGLVKAAELHLLMGRTDDALELASRIPKDALERTGHRILGLAYLARKDFEQAAEHLDLALIDEQCIKGAIEAHLAVGDLSTAVSRANFGRSISKLKSPETAKMLAVLSSRAQTVAEKLPAKDGPKTRRAVELFVCAEHGLKAGWPRECVDRLLLEAVTLVPDFAPAKSLRDRFDELRKLERQLQARETP